MPSTNKRYLKIGAAGLAATALAIGLSVGLTRDKGSDRVGAASANAYDAGATTGDFDRDSMKICSASTSSGKSGKSGGGKSGGKSGRRLVVPGTEEYVEGLAAGDGKRRKLRNELARELKSSSSSDMMYYPTYSPTTYSYGSGKSGKSGGKSGKSGDDGVTSTDQSERCIRPDNVCSYSFTSSDSSSGKSGKSGGGKSGGGKSGGGKSGGGSSYSYSGKSGKSGGGESGGGNSGGGKSGATGCGKAGKSGGGKPGGEKSGGGKSGKSGDYSSYSYSSKSSYSGNYSGKSGKSGYDNDDDDNDYCPSIAPSVCGTDCVCENGDFYYRSDDETCARSCDLTEACEGEDGTITVPGYGRVYCGISFLDISTCCNAADVSPSGCRQKADNCGECLCEAQEHFYFVDDEGACFKSCELSRACDDVPAPDYCGDDLNYEFADVESCCAARFEEEGRAACLAASRECGVPPTPVPTNTPAYSPVKLPTPSLIEPPTPTPTYPPVEAFPPTPSPTMGSTPTVSTEATGPPTKTSREVV